jgi:hypothetical protein
MKLLTSLSGIIASSLFTLTLASPGPSATVGCPVGLAYCGVSFILILYCHGTSDKIAPQGCNGDSCKIAGTNWYIQLVLSRSSNIVLTNFAGNVLVMV